MLAPFVETKGHSNIYYDQEAEEELYGIKPLAEAANNYIIDLNKEVKELKEKLEIAERFEKHIEEHLNEGEVVICKICGKSANEIKREVV